MEIRKLSQAEIIVFMDELIRMRREENRFVTNFANTTPSPIGTAKNRIHILRGLEDMAEATGEILTEAPYENSLTYRGYKFFQLN